MDEAMQAQVERTLALIDDTLAIEEITPIEAGRSRLFRLTNRQESGDGTTPEEANEPLSPEDDDLILKTTPPEEPDDDGIRAESRLLGLLSTATTIPVPALLGVIDDGSAPLSPSFVMEAMPGEALAYERIGWLDDETLSGVARDVGASLGELHGVDCLSGYGHVRATDSDPLRGGVPENPRRELDAASGINTWEEFLDRWLDREFGRHEDSPFAALTPALRSWAMDRRSVLDTGVADGPVLGRNDHGLHNLLIDRQAGSVTAMLDWAYTLGVTPAFDVEYAIYLYSGAFLAGLPDVRDRRALVREAVTAGYRATAPDLAETALRGEPLYELLAMVRVMSDFELLAPQLPDERLPDIRERITADARELVAEE